MSKSGVGALAGPDRIILRLNKLLANPGGLNTFLSTVNYTLYILTYLEPKFDPLKERLNYLINRNATTPKVTPVVPAGSSHIAAAGSLLSQTRTLLRCLGLFPLYDWARKLAEGPKGQDLVLYNTAVAQCAAYIMFQFLENVAFLTDAKVLPPGLTAQWRAKSRGTTAWMYQWSYRMWMVAISCDFVRLAREAQITREKRSKRSYAERDDKAIAVQDEKDDAQFYKDVIVPAAWFPMAYHYSAWTEAGIPGWNLGWMGFSGLVASYSKAKAQWKATK